MEVFCKIDLCSAGVYLLTGKRSIGNLKLLGKRLLLCWEIVFNLLMSLPGENNIFVVRVI